jgi:HSP20 family protein
MTKLTLRGAHYPFQDLFDWADSPWTTLMPFTPAQAFRVEDYYQDGRYVVRAELPGLDPEKDVEVTVDAGILTITAERHEEQKDGHRSEFRYGSLSRSIKLPQGAADEEVTAKYDRGILEVMVPVKEAKRESHRVAIKTGG